MDEPKQLIRELAAHALSKTGARQSPSHCNFSPLEYPQIELPGASWTTYFESSTLDDGTPVAQIPVCAQRLKEHRDRYSSIQQTNWMERDGHVQMAVPLNAGIPIEFLRLLIDEAHAIVWEKLGDRARKRLELADRPYDEAKLLDQLIELHEATSQRDAIHRLLRPSILLRTRRCEEGQIPLGATKIGGCADLPAKTPWPTYRGGGMLAFLNSGGKPLAFLVQIDLAEIARLGSPIVGLPSAGLLSLFSVWGWAPEPGDPEVPTDGTESRQEKVGWTQAILTPAGTKLERRQTPEGLNSFRAAAVTPTPILTLPSHSEEPPIGALHWSQEEYERYDWMEMDFRSIQTRHWLKQSEWLTGRHLLGGHAHFQQQFPSEVVAKRLAMLLEIDTDPNTKMLWGDGGELTFYADAKALSQGRFERIWGTCQGG